MKTSRLLAALVSGYLVALGSSAGAQTAPVCGDVNDSGGVNAVDALLVLKKGVGQSVTLDCSAYEEQTESCQDDLDACEEGTRCGDGSVNSVGEHCDENDLGGASCASFGYAAGTLGCNGNCKFDTSGCTNCPEGSNFFNGACWLLGAASMNEGEASCDAACESIGLACSETLLQSVGSGGTDESCRFALDIADPAAAPHPISTLSPQNITCGDGTDYAFGCAYGFDLVEPGANGALRFLHNSSPTLCEADYVGSFCATPTRRVCACTIDNKS